MTYNGKIYGLVVDGDVLVTYYRKDLFEDPENQKAFKEKYGYDLGAAQELQGVRRHRLLPDREVSAGRLYGAGVINTGYTLLLLQRALPQQWRQVLRSGDDEGNGQQRSRRQGADRNGRAEQVHVARHRDLGLCRESLGAQCRRNRHDHLMAAARTLGARRQYRRQGAVLGAEDHGRRQGRLLPINPGGHPELASGFISGVSPDSKNKDAAYLYAQWMHSKTQSLVNVMKPGGTARSVPHLAL